MSILTVITSVSLMEKYMTRGLVVPTADGRTILPSKGIAQELRVSERTIHRWVKEGKIPVMRAGRLLRFDLAEVLAAMRDGTLGRTADAE